MWCVFITANGAYCKFVAFTDELDRLVSESRELVVRDNKLYGAFVYESDANRFVDTINSATF